MKWVFRAAVVIGGAAALLLGIGLLLPRDRSFTRWVAIAQPRNVVWNALTDCAAQPSWRPELKSCERLADENGHPAYRLTRWSGASTQIEVMKSVAPESISVRVANLPAGATLTWIFNLTPMNGGTEISLTRNDSVGNPVARLPYQIFLRAKVTDEFLESLERKFGGRAGLPSA